MAVCERVSAASIAQPIFSPVRSFPPDPRTAAMLPGLSENSRWSIVSADAPERFWFRTHHCNARKRCEMSSEDIA